MKVAAPTLARLLGDWHLDPAVLAACVVAAAIYGLGVRRARKPWPPARSAAFLAGLLVLMETLQSGADAYSEDLLSVHVAEHLLLGLLAPSLILWGQPIRLALSSSPTAGRRIIGGLLRRRWVRFLTRPACGFALFALVVLGTHLTGIYELALRNATIHAGEHAAFFLSGMLFLLPLLAADPIPHPPGAIVRFSWLMAAMIVMSIPAGLFLFDGDVRYPFYLAPARALHISALSDQRTAGTIMLVGCGVAMGALATVVAMRAMIAEERRQLRRDSYAFRALRRARVAEGLEPR